MANINVNISARKQKALDWVVARANSDRAAETPPRGPITTDQYLAALLDGALDSYVEQHREEVERKGLREQFESASPATQAQVKTLLGIGS